MIFRHRAGVGALVAAGWWALLHVAFAQTAPRPAPSSGHGREVEPPPVEVAVSARFHELTGPDQERARALGYGRDDTVWRALSFDPRQTLIAVTIGAIIPAADVGAGPRVAISGFEPCAAKLSDAWGVMLASSPVATFSALPTDLQAEARALGYSADDAVVFTATDPESPHLVILDPCTGPSLKTRLPDSRKRFDLHLGRLLGFQQFSGCAPFDELHRTVQAVAAANGYGAGDRVLFVYDSSRESATIVPR